MVQLIEAVPVAVVVVLPPPPPPPPASIISSPSLSCSFALCVLSEASPIGAACAGTRCGVAAGVGATGDEGSPMKLATEATEAAACSKPERKRSIANFRFRGFKFY
jgi:hypothetical protein